MQMQIVISGPRVHGVGYRYFLLTLAMRESIDRFSASNAVSDEGVQQVIVLLDDPDPAVIGAFQKAVTTTHPERAVLDRVEFGVPARKVPKLTEFAQVLSAEQLLKAIPIIQGHTDLLAEIRENSAEAAASLRGDRLTRMEEDIRAIKARLGMA